jgi:hypothetical protein
MFKFVFKWVFRLCLLAVLLVGLFVAFLVWGLDPLLRVVVEHNLRANTGMDAELGQFHLGLVEPVVTLRDLRLYNGPEYGGAPFLNIPELHVEYDREALRRGQIHVTLMRFNLSELDIVKNEAGQTNLFALALLPAAKTGSVGGSANPAANPSQELLHRTGLKFDQIDLLNVSVGRFKYLDLKNPRNNREQVIGLDSLPVHHVKSMADLTGLMVMVALRSGNFFTALVLPAGSH